MPQSLSSILVHLLFSTKYREPFIKPDIEPNLHAYLATVFRECQCPSLIVGGHNDHLHALFSLHRTRSLADVVEEIKKRSSKWMKTNGAEYQQFQWQGGLGSIFNQPIGGAGSKELHCQSKTASSKNDVSR